MTVVAAHHLVDALETLPSLPVIVQRIIAVTGNASASADDVARVLSEDQAIAAKILRVANSSFYGNGQRVTQISRAVVLVGGVGVRNLIFGIAARDAVRSPTAPHPRHAALWRHSIAVASAAELIARQIGYRPAEEALVAGLLQDIGQLAMLTVTPRSFDVLYDAPHCAGDILDLERQRLGIDHADAGGMILRRWGIPKAICDVAQGHHADPRGSETPPPRLTSIVMLADALAETVGFGTDIFPADGERTAAVAAILGLDAAARAVILGNLSRRIDEALQMFAAVDCTEGPAGT